MRKTILKNTVLYLGIAFYSLSTSAIMPALAGLQNTGLKNDDRGNFPEGRVGGGTRSASICASQGTKLVALSPNDNVGVTASAEPLIYIATPNLNRSYPAQFFLYDEAGAIVYEQTLEVGQVQKFVGIRLPKETLNINQNYNWVFEIFCSGVEDDFNNLIGVSGFLRRVAREEPVNNVGNLEEKSVEESLALVQSYQEAGLWSDAIAMALELRQNHPYNEGVLNQWEQVLSALEFNEYEGLLEMLLAIKVP